MANGSTVSTVTESASLHSVSHNGETLGPWSVAEIAQRLGFGEISVTDFVWDDSAGTEGDWVPLMEFGKLKQHILARKPKAPRPTAETTAAKTSTPKAEVKATNAPSVAPSFASTEALEWYVSRSKQTFGPFSYYGVIKALQDRSIFEFDYILNSKTETWVRIAEHELFSADAIRKVMEEDRPGLFVQRKYPRYPMKNEVLVHDNSDVSTGEMFEVGAGGTGVVLKNARLMPGQLVHLHIASSEGLPAFNVVGEIVSKKYTRAVRDARTPIQYGIRFVKMDAAAEKRVKEYFEKLASGPLSA